MKKNDNARLIERFRPIVYFHSKETWTPASIEFLIEDSQLFSVPWYGASPSGDPVPQWFAGGVDLVSNPTTADLAAHPQRNMQILLDRTRYNGEGWGAPMYVSVQRDPGGGFIDINYVFLFAYTGARCLAVLRPHASFSCGIPPYGVHEGGVEIFGVRVGTSDEQPLHVRFEARGLATYYAPSEVDFQDGHPIAGLGLYSHGVYNLKGRRLGEWIEVEAFEGLGIAARHIDVLPDTTANVWKPDRLIEVGIGPNGLPINDQTWVVFQGRLGRAESVSAKGDIVAIDSPLQKEQVAYAAAIAAMLGQAVTSHTEDPVLQLGVPALGGRAIVRQDRPIDRPKNVAIRLRQRPHLALTAAGSDTQFTRNSVSPFTGRPTQIWEQRFVGNNFSLRSAQRGTALYFVNQHLLEPGDFPPTDDRAVFSLSPTPPGDAMAIVQASDPGHALTSKYMDQLNQPGWPIVAPWQFIPAAMNQDWIIEEIGKFVWPMPLIDVTIRSAWRPYLALTASASGITAELYMDGSAQQRWHLVQYFSDGIRPCYGMFNAATGKALFSMGQDNRLDTLTPRYIGDGGIWDVDTLPGLPRLVFRLFQNTDWGLSISGDPSNPRPQSPVGVYRWQGGWANELWAMTDATASVPTREVSILCLHNTDRTIEPDNNISVFCRSYDPNNLNQRWILTQYGPCFTLQHAASGRFLRFNGAREPLIMVGPGDLDLAGRYWNLDGPAVQATVNTKQNLNVMGSDDPTVGHQVGAWDWNHGQANETWTFQDH